MPFKLMENDLAILRDLLHWKQCEQFFTKKVYGLTYPKFDREDSSGWITQAEQFYNFNRTPDQERAPLVEFHME